MTIKEAVERAQIDSTKIRLKPDHERGISKLCKTIKENGVPLTDRQLYAANTITVDELAFLLAEDRFITARAYALEQQRLRQDKWAEEHA